MKRSRSARNPFTLYQNLEERRLLAGDVTATLDGSSLILRGDNAGNDVLVSVNEAGNVEVSGQNETTVNGSDAPVTFEISGAEIENFRALLAGGDDSLFVEDLTISDRVIVRGGNGDDAVGFLDTVVGDDLFVNSGNGADNVSVDTVQIGDRLSVKTEFGEDIFGLDNSIVSGRTNVDTGASGDRVALRDSVHESRVRILTGGGADFVSADGLTIDDVANIETGGRADNVFVNDTSFSARVVVKGSGGDDALQVAGDTSFDVPPRVISFSGDQVPGALAQTDQVFSDLISSGARLGTITELAALTPELSTLVGALELTGLDEALAGDGAFTVFAPLNSAFEDIEDIVAGLDTDELTDVLLFHVAAGEIFADELVMMDSVETLLEQSFTVEITGEGVILNGNATLAATDIRAKNGVVHVLNDVLIPAI